MDTGRTHFKTDNHPNIGLLFKNSQVTFGNIMSVIFSKWDRWGRSLCAVQVKGTTICPLKARAEEETIGQVFAYTREPTEFPSHPMTYLKVQTARVGSLNLCNIRDWNPVAVIFLCKGNCGKGVKTHNAIDCLSQSNIDSVYASQTP